MKKLKHLLTTSLMTKDIINKPFLVLESRSILNKDFNQKNFSKAFSTQISLTSIDSLDLKFPLTLTSLNYFNNLSQYIHNAFLNKINLVFIKFFNYVILKRITLFYCFSLNSLLAKISSLFKKTFLLLFIIKHYKKV